MVTYLLTRDSPERFNRVFNFLASSKNAKTDEVKLEASFLVLSDLPIESVEVAAQALCKEANPFMPDDGSWYQLADNLAHENLVRELSQTKQLTAPEDVVMEDKRREARAKFLASLEGKFGAEVADRYSRIIPDGPIPLFHCHQCQDTGWREYNCTRQELCASCKQRQFYLYDHTWVEHCVCWHTNPRLEQHRAQSKLKTRRKKNR